MTHASVTFFICVLGMAWQLDPTELGLGAKPDSIAFDREDNASSYNFFYQKHNKKMPPSTIMLSTMKIVNGYNIVHNAMYMCPSIHMRFKKAHQKINTNNIVYNKIIYNLQ